MEALVSYNKNSLENFANSEIMEKETETTLLLWRIPQEPRVLQTYIVWSSSLKVLAM